MLTQEKGKQLKIHCITIEDLVPKEHFLRKVDKHVNFSFIYDEVKGLYSTKIGRPSIDPVVIVKYLLVGFLYGIPSERRIEQEIQVNVAYRWFLGLDLDEKAPDHSTISQLRRRKQSGAKLFRSFFEQILADCIEKNLVDGKLILTDSTHVKANASKKSELKIQVEKQVVAYWERLDKYEEEERQRLESEGKIKPPKKRRESTKKPEKVSKTVSTSDPEAGRLNRPGKPEGMHYLDHQSIDAKNGIIVDVTVTAGNVSDCVPYMDCIEKVKESIDVKAAAVDSGYDTSLIHKEMEEHGITIFTPEKKTSDTSKTEYKRGDFSYDEEADEFTCPNGEKLKIQRLQRNESTITREYKAETNSCKDCPYREKCLAPSQKCRKIQVNIFEEIVRRHHENDGSAEYKEALKKRLILSEGSFAVQKRAHNLSQILRYGLEAAETHCLLSAIALNLKRMIKCATYA